MQGREPWDRAAGTDGSWYQRPRKTRSLPELVRSLSAEKLQITAPVPGPVSHPRTLVHTHHAHMHTHLLSLTHVTPRAQLLPLPQRCHHQKPSINSSALILPDSRAHPALTSRRPVSLNGLRGRYRLKSPASPALLRDPHFLKKTLMQSRGLREPCQEERAPCPDPLLH